MARDFDIEQVAQAIEAGMGGALPDIWQALAEVKACRVGSNAPGELQRGAQRVVDARLPTLARGT